MIDNYWDYEFRNDIEQLFDDINNIILEIFESNGKELSKEIIFKILDFETKLIDFLSCCKTW